MPAFTLAAGEFFGELGLVAGRRRTATIVAAAPSVMVEIPVRAMRRLLSAVAAMRQELDRVALRRLVHTTLGPQRPIAELDDIIAAASLRRVKAGQAIITAGSDVDALFILRSGSASVTRLEGGRATNIGFVAAGGLFGERGFLDAGATRAATVTATVASEVVVIDAAAVRVALVRTPALRGVFTQAVQTQLDQTLRATVARAALPAPGA